MKRLTIAFVVICLLAPGALAQFQPPQHLQRPTPGHPHLPTPHLPGIPTSYYLSCTLGTSPVVSGHLWHVTNEGRNTAPAGLHFYVASGGFIHADFRLGSALASGDGQDFVSPATKFDHPSTNNDSCTVSFDR
ncbi:MAG TPA: hypothetical protein VII56_23345 [Rhizomicrobium sp.]